MSNSSLETKDRLVRLKKSLRSSICQDIQRLQQFPPLDNIQLRLAYEAIGRNFAHAQKYGINFDDRLKIDAIKAQMAVVDKVESNRFPKK